MGERITAGIGISKGCFLMIKAGPLQHLVEETGYVYMGQAARMKTLK